MPLRSLPARDAIRRRNHVGRIGSIGDRLKPYVKPQFLPDFTITETSRVFCMGSCFARNVERALEAASLDVVSSRFSVPSSEYGGTTRNSILNKYTPPSIWQELSWVAGLMDRGKEVIDYTDIEGLVYVIDDGRVVDGQLNGLKPVTMDRAIERRQTIYDLFCQIAGCDVFVLTLGLIECWFDKTRKSYIQQVPTEHLKERLDDFEFHQLDVISSLDFIRRSVAVLRKINPHLKIVVTTSPVVLARTFTDDDLIVANNLSKSTLRTVAGTIAATEGVIYFPSFEMATLTVDSPVYEDDHSHIRDDFVRKIIAYFVESVGNEAVVSRFRKENRLAELASSDKPEALLDAIRGEALESLSNEIVFRAAAIATNCAEPAAERRYETEALRRCESDLTGEVTQAVSQEFNAWLIAMNDSEAFWRLADRDQPGGIEIFDMTYLRRARRLLDADGPVAALPLAQRAFERMPENETAVFVYARVLNETGRGEDSLRVLESLDQIQARLPAAHRLRAKLLASRNERDAALESARKALCLKPDDKASLRLIERLEGTQRVHALELVRFKVSRFLRSWRVRGL